MKVQELRIGNWVEHNDEWCYRGEDVYQFQWDDSDWYALGESIMFIENINPIPLTEQWLIDFGFEKDDNGVDIHDQDYHEWYQKEFPIIGVLCQSSDKAYLFDENTDTLRIKYVHQLQNLYYALTGEDLL